MPIFEAVRMALRTIRTQKLKSFFSLIGVLIGVTFLIAVVSIVQGMNVYMEDKFANQLVGVNTFQVRRFSSFNNNVGEDTWREWLRRPRVNYREAALIEERLETPALFSRKCWGDVNISYGGKVAKQMNLEAVDEDYFRIKNYAIANGRAFTPQEVKAGTPVIVIGHEVAERLFAGLDPVGRSASIAGLPYRVIGVVEKQGTLFGISLDKFGIVPFTSQARRELCNWNVVHEFWVKTGTPQQMMAAVTEVEGIMRVARQLKPGQENNFYIQTAEGALSSWEKISRILFLALPGLVAISLVVGGIVIMNIMLMAVAERTREIGIRKALGARRRDILAQFVVEAATLSTVGAALGIAVGIALAFLVAATTPLPAAVAPWSVAVGVVLGITVGITAGVYPASRAARLDPIVALRAE
ncbi:MAG: ABC transporter permease [Gemmatimonadota bacterium]